MTNYLQCIWWNDTAKAPEPDKDVLVLRKGMFFVKLETANSNALPEDCVAWAYLDKDDVHQRLVREFGDVYSLHAGTASK